MSIRRERCRADPELPRTLGRLFPLLDTLAHSFNRKLHTQAEFAPEPLSQPYQNWYCRLMRRTRGV
jgi:hypothetical protein